MTVCVTVITRSHVRTERELYDICMTMNQLRIPSLKCEFVYYKYINYYIYRISIFNIRIVKIDKVKRQNSKYGICVRETAQNF